MCVQPAPWPEPDPQIAAVIAAKYLGKRPRPLAVQVRDRLGQWLADEAFAAAFGVRGKLGWSPSRLALVTVLQRVEDLAGRQAAEAVRTRIDWQYLLAVLEALTAAHPDWVAQRICAPGFARRYGTPMTSWRPPQSEARRRELAIAYARDGYALLEAVYDPSAPGWLRELPAVDVLRRVPLQNYTRTITGSKEVIKRREKEPEGDGLPPGHMRIASPYDLDARWGAKREEFWLGCELHITETSDDAPTCSCRATVAARPAAEGAVAGGRSGSGRGHDKACTHLVFPNLITHVATTDATVTGNQMTGAIHDDLAGTDLAPGRHYLDPGYLSAAVAATGHARHGITLIGPLLADTSAQARAGQGYARADFTVGYDTRTVTCPQGKTARSWSPCTQHGKDTIVAIFSTTDCGPCAARSLCTAAKRRVLSLPPPGLVKPRPQPEPRKRRYLSRPTTPAAPASKAPCTRPPATAHGARYHGLPKTLLDHVYMAVALNLLRLEACWTGTPLDRQRTSHLARLELGLAA
jgi:hypothetical protein